MKTLKLSLNPFEPNHKKYKNLQMMVHAPYTHLNQAKQNPPQLGDLLVDEEHPEAPTRRVLVSFMNPAIDEYEFDLDTKATYEVSIQGQVYKISLIAIGEEEIPQFKAQNFLYFIFNIEEK